MKIRRFGHGQKAQVPTTWIEAEHMLNEALNPHIYPRGANLARISAASRVAYGMFDDQFKTGNPTIALLCLMRRICQRQGAGLDK